MSSNSQCMWVVLVTVTAAPACRNPVASDASSSVEEPQHPSAHLSPAQLENGCACSRPAGCPVRGLGWDRLADPVRLGRPLAHRVLAALDLSSRQRVLDVGAGFGFWTLLASEAVGEKGHVLAIDSNPYCASLMDRELTAREVNNVEVQSCSLETLEQPSTPFDVILCKNALRFPEDQRSKGLSGVRLSPGRTVRRFWDLLDSGGRVVLIPLVTSNDCMPASEIVSLFEDTGFRILSEDDPRDFGLSVPDTPERCGTLLVAQKP